MIVGVPREAHRHEHRVGLNPFVVARLTQQGHTVLVENGAGEAARFSTDDYQRAGGRIVYENEEVYQRADMVCRVGELSPGELGYLKPGSVVCAFHHLAVAPRETVQRLVEVGATLIGYEIIRDDRGELPVLTPFSEMGGQLAVQLAAHYLQIGAGGRGVLLGSIPGVPPATVVVLGAGTVGRSAARHALAAGAHVIVLDADVRKLRELTYETGGHVATAMAATERLEQYTAIADVVIGAVLIPGERAPFVVTEAMVKAMKPGSVIVDVSIDQGGCVETSRPTQPDHPVFVEHGVVHYCVPNMTASVPRTASRALANAVLPYVLELAGRGVAGALRTDAGLARGVYLYRGRIVHEPVARALDLPGASLDRLLDEGGAP